MACQLNMFSGSPRSSLSLFFQLQISKQLSFKRKEKVHQTGRRKELKMKQTIYFLYQPLQFLGGALLVLLLLLLRILQLSLRAHVLRVVLVVSPPRLQTKQSNKKKEGKMCCLVTLAGSNPFCQCLTYRLHLCGHLEQPILQVHTDVFALKR